MHTKTFDQPVGNETLKVEITTPRPEMLPSVFALHGAGPGNRVRIDYLARFLASQGKSVLRFDFSGHGESTGKLENSSLDKRLKEALAISKHLSKDPITLIASSMGGHIAVRLLEHLPVENLILFCPAAYSQAAEPLVFGQAFTEEIRRPKGYINSPLWPILERFKGKVMFVIGSEDTIIPDDVVAHYISSLRNCSLLNYQKIPGAPHAIHVWFEKNPEIQKAFLNSLAGFLKTTKHS